MPRVRCLQKLWVSLSIILAYAIGSIATAEAQTKTLLLATTTSVQDSGLLDELLPAFTEKTGIRVQTVAVGTGAGTAGAVAREGSRDPLGGIWNKGGRGVGSGSGRERFTKKIKFLCQFGFEYA